MSETPTTALIASVRQRLLNGARERGEDFQLTLTRYGIERLLYRLSQSAHRDGFILKGAALLAVWSQDQDGLLYRPTRDVDLWGSGEPSVAAMATVFRAVIATPVEPDGLIFPAEAVRSEAMREDELFEGCRLHLLALLGAARIPLQVDIGFGDAVTPAASEGTYPTLLHFSAPHLRLYPRETVVAEKFEAMVSLGLINTRMKDFYDLWLLSERFAFDGPPLVAALTNTFARRNTSLPQQTPLALTPVFTQETGKVSAWQSFLRRSGLLAPELPVVAAHLERFLLPPAHAAAGQRPFEMQWQPGHHWM